MIGQSLPELIFIRTCIFFLHRITPTLLTYLFLSIFFRPTSTLFTWYNLIIIGYCILDILFALCVYWPYQWRLKKEAKYPPPLSRPERKALLVKCLEHMPDPDHYLRLWFLNADDKDIKRQNVKEFLMWAFLDKAPTGLVEGDDDELEEYLDIVEDKMQRKFEPGRGNAQSLRLSIDAVDTRYRTVGWYIIVGVVDMITHCLLGFQGFKYFAQARSSIFSVIPFRLQSLLPYSRSSSKEMAYWYRPHTARDKIPIVFLHGIGIGLWPYVPFFRRLTELETEDTCVGLIAIEILPISFRLTKDPLSKFKFLDELVPILDAHGWSKFTVVTHSYGSVVATHMFSSPEIGPRVEAALMIDPVSILLHLPDVAYNFTRRQPKKANEWLLWYFASMDPGVAHCLGRHFHWKENIAWKEDVLGMSPNPATNRSGGGGSSRPRKVAVCLAERDLIVDTLSVARYLVGDAEWRPSDATLTSAAIAAETTVEHVSRNDIELAWFPGLDHAQVFDYAPSTQEICKLTHWCCSKTSDE